MIIPQIKENNQKNNYFPPKEQTNSKWHSVYPPQFELYPENDFSCTLLCYSSCTQRIFFFFLSQCSIFVLKFSLQRNRQVDIATSFTYAKNLQASNLRLR